MSDPIIGPGERDPRASPPEMSDLLAAATLGRHEHVLDEHFGYAVWAADGKTLVARVYRQRDLDLYLALRNNAGWLIARAQECESLRLALNEAKADAYTLAHDLQQVQEAYEPVHGLLLRAKLTIENLMEQSRRGIQDAGWYSNETLADITDELRKKDDRSEPDSK